MPQVNMVMLGAEALAENGGLINFVSLATLSGNSKPLI